MNERQNQGLQTLKDVSKTGKDRQWRERKLKKYRACGSVGNFRVSVI